MPASLTRGSPCLKKPHEVVVAFLSTHSRGRASGVELHFQVAHVLRFADGKCIASLTYLDRDEALRSAGLR